MQPRTAGLIALLIVLPLITFGRVLGHGFVNWDDQSQLYENPDFNPPSVHAIAKYWRGPHMNLYLPVTYTLWGGVASVGRLERPDGSGALLDARYFHATNLILHIASTLLVFAILRTLRVEQTISAIAAAVFSVHPIMVEPIAWASAMYTVLSGMLSLLAVWQYLRFARPDQEGRKDQAALVIATVALVLAMLSKPSAVVTPVIAAALDLFILGRPWPRVAKPIAIWLCTALPIMAAATWFQPAGQVQDMPLWQRPIIAADAIGFYVGKVLLPLNFAADYGRSPEAVMGGTAWIATSLITAILVAAVLWARGRAKWVVAALMTFVAGVGPYLGLKKFDYQYWSTVSDRYLYLSMLGVAVLIAYALARMPVAARWVACVVVVLLAARSSVQAGVWRDSKTLFGSTLAVNPDSVVAHSTLAYLATREGDTDSAMTHYRATLRVKPRDGGANFNLGNALMMRGDLKGAIALYRVAAESKPPSALVFNNLGVALAQLKQYDGAEAAFARAVNIEPNLEMARKSLSLVRSKRAEATTRP